MNPPATLFQSFFQGGFECSTHVRRDGKRLDVIAATQHDVYAESDYRLLREYGMQTARDAARWHLIEKTPGQYDFSSFLPMVRAAQRAGMQVIWDFCHYGWPSDLDIWSPRFADRFAAFARATASVLRDETDAVPFICPMNEISFFAWGGGDTGYINPFGRGRGTELKVQLVRAAIACIDAIRQVLPQARIVHCEPTIHIVADPGKPQDREEAEGHTRSQFQALDMVAGRAWPQLGGREDYIDIVGVNYYFNNQWIHRGKTLTRSDPSYVPLRHLLIRWFEQYKRPVFISETGIENDPRPEWLAYVCGEVRAAQAAGVPIQGICLYPILNHPGWDNDRHCYNGLFDYPDSQGQREAYGPLAEQLRYQREIFGISPLSTLAGAHQ